ncbi:TPA: TetR/AcrR family transcriptional regulator [Burkholderia cenocepacia]|nr:TetR/AcrR family transcriptional regulator [Burkholderia cenocepacia]HDR9888528.1 TetR/AcrR family transcriptional regulator [Burkholderia cenocepacia]
MCSQTPLRRPTAVPKNRRVPAGAAVLQQDVTAAISRAVFREIARVGYASMTMDAVARRAGVGKAAIYRRWPSKQAMVVNLLSQVGLLLADVPDTGSLDGDVMAFLVQAHALLRRPLVRNVLRELYAEMDRSPALATVIRRDYQEGRRERVKKLLQRGIDRGELKRSLDKELALDLLAAPLYWRIVVTRNPVDADYLRALTALTVAGLRSL